jgi:hypothetical protein
VIDPGDDGDYQVDLTSISWSPVIDNPLLPLTPGATWTYETAGGGEVETTEVIVTDDVKDVSGISATVVRDTVSVGGEIIEDTYDWYAQDTDGNVWYLGEDTAEYEDGQVVSKEGSWEAGVDGALPGIVMGADPAPGDAYRQEYYPGHAEDLAEVVDDGVAETVPFGTFEDLLVIREWNPLAPEVVEEKYYASGIGMVLEVVVEGGNERVELITFEP